MKRHPEFIGEFEQMVLLAILQLGDKAYAVPIREELATRANRKLTRGALYTTLERLEVKAYLRSHFGDPLAERGGRARRYYAVTTRGVAALRTARQAFRNLYQGLDAVLGEGS